MRNEATGEARVVQVGTHGYGRNHLRNLARLSGLRPVRLVGLCDLRPPDDLVAELFGSAAIPVSAALPELIDKTEPHVVIVSTPIHTHAELAIQAFEAGCHVLLEKPPTASMADFDRVRAAARHHQRACQVGFQDLASSALPAIRTAIEDGAIGEVHGIGMAGTWVRDTSYYERATWAGRRELDGTPVVDGALTNPFAHGLAAALWLAEAQEADRIQHIETELYRAHAIEADDTACLRITTTAGSTVTAAVTLCAAKSEDPRLVVHGSRGRITLWYKRHEVAIRTPAGTSSHTHDRTDLLENLLDHLTDPSTELLVGLGHTGGFMAAVEAVRTSPPPSVIAAEHQDVSTLDGQLRRVVHGVDNAVDAAAEQLRLFSELDLEWARR